MTGVRLDRMRTYCAIAEADLSANKLKDMEGFANIYEWLSSGVPKQNPGPKAMRELCIMTDTSADYLLKRTNEKKSSGERTEEMPPIAKHLEVLLNEKKPNSAYVGKIVNYRSRFRNGSEIRLASVVSIAEAFGCSVDYLLGLGD